MAKKMGGWREPMSDVMRREIITALRETPNATQIAQQRGDVCAKTVRRIANKEGIHLPAGRPATSEIKKAEILADFDKNAIGNVVARNRGDISPNSVMKFAREAHREIGKPGGSTRALNPQKRAAIVAALGENPNATQVTEDLGDVSLSTVYGIAHQERIGLKRGARRKTKIRTATPQ